MRDTLDLRNFVNASPAKETLVLCTLVAKSGSSYRGIGAQKIVNRQSACGLLSGGCLEGSIEKTARERSADMPFTEAFSTLSDEDRLMGYQTGCQGVIDISFEAFTKEEMLDKMAQLLPYDPIQLNIIGCGADAPVYKTFAEALGWQLHFFDYRRDLAQADYLKGSKVTFAPLAELAQHIPQGPLSAVVLMTHNYESDLEILRGMRDYQIGYLGCLGPKVRFERLKKDLHDFHSVAIAEHLENVVSAPAGLFSHSASPSEIALSVIAQIQGVLIENPGKAQRLPAAAANTHDLASS